MQNYVSYSDAGVDIEAGDDAVTRMKPLSDMTKRSGVLGGIGGFASLFRLKDLGDFDDPILVSGTDGVGTKLLVALQADKHEWIGQDLVAMCANDILTVGAKPIFFLDYFATSSVKDSPLLRVVESIAKACKSIDCALAGGETAEMPGLYQPHHYDLAGFCVGVVEKAKLVDGTRVKPGHCLIGLHSSGIHSNGFSLARHIIFERLGMKITDTLPGGNISIGDALLEPTRLYVGPVLKLLKDGAPIHAMAHITGGGIPGNVARGFPQRLRALVERGTWCVPPIFTFLQEQGPVRPEEMERTFNMGIGYVLAAPRHDAMSIVKQLESLGEKASIIGEVTI